MERPTCRTAIMLKTGLEWLKLLIVSLITILAWQVSRGAEKPVPGPNAEWHAFITMMSADTDDRLVEQEYSGSNEPFEAYDSPVDCIQNVIQLLPPPQLGHTKLLVNCRIVPPSGELKPALLRRRRR
jgi:hypothetical protein